MNRPTRTAGRRPSSPRHAWVAWLSALGAACGGCQGLLGVDFDDARPASPSAPGPSIEAGDGEGGVATGSDAAAACDAGMVECLAADGSVACCAQGPGLGQPISLAAGGHETCALTSTGAIACWGANESGQLGAGTIAPATGSNRPVRVLRIPTGATQLSVGGAHVCAVVRALGDGPALLACWGSNSSGQLGNGTTTAAPLPTAIPLPRAIGVVGAGTKATCAVLQERGYCWGANDRLQAGSDMGEVVLAPRAVEGLAVFDTASVEKKRHVIAPSDGYTCASLETTTACWGNNAHAVFGQPQPPRSAMPVDLPGVSGDDLALGVSHGCSLQPSFVPFGSDAGAPNGETVFCWGSNEFGQLGDGKPPGDEDLAFPRFNGSQGGVTSLCSGTNHTCAVHDGAVYCWGQDDFGQCGTTAPSRVPSAVAGLGGVLAKEVVCGATHTCALFEDRTIRCWGSNQNGERGDGQNGPAGATPHQVAW